MMNPVGRSNARAAKFSATRRPISAGEAPSGQSPSGFRAAWSEPDELQNPARRANDAGPDDQHERQAAHRPTYA